MRVQYTANEGSSSKKNFEQISQVKGQRRECCHYPFLSFFANKKEGVHMTKTKEDLSELTFQLILHSGNARSCAMEAIALQKQGKSSDAQEK